MYEEELDPAIAELLTETENSLPSSKSEKAFTKNISLDDIPVETKSQERKSNNVSDVDLSIQSFKPITEFFSSTPSKVFDDTTYYKTALSGEKESAQRHRIGSLCKYIP